MTNSTGASFEDDESVQGFEPGVATRRQIEMMDEQIAKYGPLLERYGMEVSLDEIAIAFPNATLLHSWISLAVRAKDVVHYNSAVDEVKVFGPIPGQYRAHYEFLELADKPYRVEAMQVPVGHSPVHSAHSVLAEPYGAWVHVSFKVPDEEAYAKACAILFETGEWLPAQICRSDYGRFTYFSPASELMQQFNLLSLYLKVRVNLRDS